MNTNHLINFLVKATMLLMIPFCQLPAQEPQGTYHRPEDLLVQQKLGQWQDIKFGLMMTWGAYSITGVVESWSICAEDEPWCFQGDDYIIHKQEYEKLPENFNPVKFDPALWAKAAKDAGMRYIVFTAKHHDGFCMFNTSTTDYKITGSKSPFRNNPKADVTREIFDAFRSEGFMTGAYFSKPDWHSEYFWWPKFSTPDRNVNYDISKHPDQWHKFVEYTHKQINELATNYGTLDILWLDGGWVRPLTPEEQIFSQTVDGLFRERGYTQLKIPQDQDIKLDVIIDSIRQKQPGLIVVDRFVDGKYQDYFTPEQYVPSAWLPYPWETCMTLGGSWSYSGNDTYKPARQIIHVLADVVSKGGNLLLNIGPGPDGTWQPDAYHRLSEIGSWMKINSSAVYNTRGMKNWSEGKFRFTQGKDGQVYAIYLADEGESTMPDKLIITSIHPSAGSKIHLLGYTRQLSWSIIGNGLCINVPEEIRKKPPSPYAWTFVITK